MSINQTINDTEASGDPDYPNIVTREMTSTIMVGDRQTAVLGGLIQTQTTRNTTQIPLLGYIPILGNLFKNDDVQKTKTELIMFITPYVILSPEDMNRVSEETFRKTYTLSPEQITEITNSIYFDTNKGTNNAVR
jgi:general secretion pathway protein D